MKASNKSFQRKYNLALVARSIWKSEGKSRVDISKDIELDKTSVSNIVSVLLDNKLIKVANVGESLPRGGRKPIYLRLNRDFGHVVGLDIQPDKCKLAVLSLNGEVLFKDEINLDKDFSLEEMIDLAMNKVKSDFSSLKKVIGCTIGIPGNVDSATGVVHKSEPFKIFNQDIGKIMYEKFDLPFFVENDANCGAWGEIFFNNKKNDGNFLFLLGELNKSNRVHNYKGGLGFGLGVVINYKVYYGFNNASGNFKSVFWKSGYDYQFGSESAKKSVSRLPGVLTDEVLEELLLNFTPLISVLNPERVVIGGDINRYTERINNLIRTNFSNSYIAEEYSNCRFVESSNGKYDVAIGAACMFLEKLFRIPELLEVDSVCNISWEKLFQSTLLNK